MGSSSSKAASKTASVAAKKTTRKYPSRPPPQPTSSRATNQQPSITRSSPTSNATAAGPTVHPPPRAASAKDYGIERDAEDPTLNPGLHARLQKLGPVQPSPTYSNSSTFNQPPHHSNFTASSDPSSPLSHFQPSTSTPTQTIFPQTAQIAQTNPAVSLLTARYRIAEEAEKEFANTGRRGVEGRRFLDVVTIRRALEMREKGVREKDIEEILGLADGVVGVLGVRGVVGVGE